MTNSSSKPSLLGRKRTKDLQQTLEPTAENPMNQVKKTLLDLQEDILSGSSAEKPKAEKKQEPEHKTPKKTAVEHPKNKKTTAKPPLDRSAPPLAAMTSVTPVTPNGKMSRVMFEQEAFEYLLKFYQNLKNPHQAIRVSYGLSEQNRRFLEAIKKVMNHYGESLKEMNLTQQEIMKKSQDLLDSLVSRLLREGVKIRPLALSFER
jgi:hypothetical protein